MPRITTRRLAGLYNTSYDFDAAEWFWDEFKKPITFEEFRNKYPQGSKGAQLFERFTSKLELAGTLVEYGFLNENLYFDRYGYYCQHFRSKGHSCRNSVYNRL